MLLSEEVVVTLTGTTWMEPRGVVLCDGLWLGPAGHVRVEGSEDGEGDEEGTKDDKTLALGVDINL